MNHFISIAIIVWLFPFLGFSQGFNTVLNPAKTRSIKLAPMVVKSKVFNDSINPASVSNKPDSLFLLNRQNVHLFAILPLKDISKLTSSFGNRKHPVTGELNKFHSGIDISARGDTVFSILPGIIEESGYNFLLGNYVSIRHGEILSIYGHLFTRFVLAGETVNTGFPIGITGQTGRVTGEHLHFTIKYKNQYINPLTFLAKLISAERRNYATAYKATQHLTKNSL